MLIKKYITATQRHLIEGDENIVRLIEPYFSIETHMSFQERLRLFAVATSLPPGFIACEIGSYLGASTCFLGVAARMQNGSIHCFDTWDNRAMGVERAGDTFAAFTQNIEPFRKQIVVHRGDSTKLAGEMTEMVDFLFVDGDHSYAGVKADLANFGPKLKPGGLLLFHDFDQPEVRRAGEEYLADHPAEDMRPTNTLQVFQMYGPHYSPPKK